jgi:hypothetical protein
MLRVKVYLVREPETSESLKTDQRAQLVFIANEIGKNNA